MGNTKRLNRIVFKKLNLALLINYKHAAVEVIVQVILHKSYCASSVMNVHVGTGGRQKDKEVDGLDNLI